MPEQTDPLILMWKQNQGPLIPLLVLKSRFLLSFLIKMWKVISYLSFDHKPGKGFSVLNRKVIFCRDEYGKLYDFVSSKKLRVKNINGKGVS